MQAVFNFLLVVDTIAVVFLITWVFADEEIYNLEQDEKQFKQRLRYAKHLAKKKLEARVKARAASENNPQSTKVTRQERDGLDRLLNQAEAAEKKARRKNRPAAGKSR